MIIARIASLLIGYIFGLFQTAYIYGKSKGIDIRKEGSGNAGTTNSLRVLGWKAGAVTFLGDLFKAIFAVLLIKLIFTNIYGDATKVLELFLDIIFRFICSLKAARESHVLPESSLRSARLRLQSV